MKTITITERNIKSVYGRLKRFFYNNNHTGFEEWHNFDCGFKKHISPIIYIGKNKIRNTNEYPAPDYIEYNSKETKSALRNNSSYISIRFTKTHGTCLYVGDKIAFCGNRIIYRSEEIGGEHKYCYSVFQVLQMGEYKQRQIKCNAEREYREWVEDWAERYERDSDYSY